MRWVFAADSDRDERQRRAAVEQQMQTFWAAFADAREHLQLVVDGKDAWDPTDWMNQLIWPIEAGIIWEMGRLDGGSYELVLTAEATHSLRPLIGRLLELAPPLPGWRVVGWRDPAPAPKVKQLFEARAGFSLDKLRFAARPGDHRRLDLAIYCDQLSPGDRRGAALAGFAAELVLGEREFYRWIGDIEIEESDADEPSFLGRFFARSAGQGRPIPELTRALATHRSDQRARPLLIDNLWNQPWAQREYRTEEAPDFTGHSDLYMAKTPVPELWDAAYAPVPFFSECFGASHFGYLKIDSTGDRTCELKTADAFAGAVHEVLAARGLGAVVGVGEGRRYHYVDVALDDVRKGVDALRDLLQPMNPALRSWLLFHDADWVEEWVGVYEESPMPPRWAGIVGG